MRQHPIASSRQTSRAAREAHAPQMHSARARWAIRRNAAFGDGDEVTHVCSVRARCKRLARTQGLSCTFVSCSNFRIQSKGWTLQSEKFASERSV